jgi:FkbM family methyltransferase
VWTTLRDGSRILVNVNDVIGRTIYFCADHDPKLSWVLRRVLRPGDCCIDVGAHMGVISLQAARLVGGRGVVHAFEPQPVLAAMLNQSTAANGYAQLRVHDIALSEADGVLPLYVPRGGDTGVATFDGEFAPGRDVVESPVRHAGEFLASLDLPPIRLLKLDIEHHEDAFFRGAAGFLERHRPDVVLFESHDRGLGFWGRFPVAALGSLGYVIYQIPKSLLAPRPIPIAKPSDPPGRGWDFLAVRLGAPALAGLGRLASTPA